MDGWREFRPWQLFRRSLVGGLWLGLIVAQAAPAQEDEAAATAQTAITKAEIAAQIDQLQKDSELEADAKQEAAGILQSALDEWNAGHEAGQQQAEFERRRRRAIEELDSLRQSISALPEKAVPPALPEFSLEQLERRREELQAKLDREGTGLKDQQQKLAEEIRNRNTRLEAILAKLTDAELRLEQAQNTLKSLPSGEASSPAQAAHHLLCRVRAQRGGQEVAALQSERDWLESGDVNQWLQARSSLLKREAAQLGAERKLVDERIEAVRRQEAAKRVHEAQHKSRSVHPALQTLAVENERLAEESGRLTVRLEEAESELERTSRQLETVQVETEQIQSLILKIGMTEDIGLMLRQQYDQLPDVPRLRRQTAARSEEIRELRLQQFARDRLDQQTPEIEEVLQAGRRTPGPRFDEPSFKGQAEALLSHRQELLAHLEEDGERLIRSLFRVTESERKLAIQATASMQLHDEHVLWIRSGDPINPLAFASWRPVIEKLDGADAWDSIVVALQRDQQRRPALYWLFAAGGLAYLLVLLRTQHLLKRVAEQVRQPECLAISPTLHAVAVTVFRTAFWPLLLALVAWRLEQASTFGTFARWLAGGIWRVVWLAYPLLLIRAACARNGLGSAHFGWPPLFTARIRRHIGWFLPLASVLLFVIGAMEATGVEWMSESIGRTSFLLLMIAAAGFTRVVFTAGESPAERARGFTAARWMIQAVPWCLILLAAAGYYYTAARLTWRLQETLWVAVALAGLHATLLRWIQLEERRIARRVELTPESPGPRAEKCSPLFALQRAPSADRRLDVASITRQMQGLLRVSLAVACCIGVWAIWSDVLPAFNILNQITLWQTTVMKQVKDAETGAALQALAVVESVSVADLAVAIFIAGVTLLAVRNIPGLVQAVLLEGLPLDAGARFAVVILVRYALLVTGIVISCAQINIGWSNVQWLVAAASVGLGFGLQEIVANFVSGIILLFERPLRVGDVITIGDTTGTVSQIRVRSTTILDADRKELVVPNKDLITGKLLNWTLTDRTNRIAIRVGVSYDSDPDRVRSILQEIALAHPSILKQPPPNAAFEEFGPTALVFVLRAFLPSLDDRSRVIHELHATIHSQFQQEGIDIFPPNAARKPPTVPGVAA